MDAGALRGGALRGGPRTPAGEEVNPTSQLLAQVNQQGPCTHGRRTRTSNGETTDDTMQFVGQYRSKWGAGTGGVENDLTAGIKCQLWDQHGPPAGRLIHRRSCIHAWKQLGEVRSSK